MFLVSNILNGWLKWRLKSKAFRSKAFIDALNHDLRDSRYGQALIRNINEAMATNPEWHAEFEALAQGKSYQEAFWESDLGYLWYTGNLNRRNEYFAYVIKELTANKYTSHMDVGCGWGELTIRVAKLPFLQHAVGIDVAQDVIRQAKRLAEDSEAVFVCLGVLEVEEPFDLITIIGSTDYIPAGSFAETLQKMIELARKKVIIVNSLRGLTFEEAQALTESREVLRYDKGCVHPIHHLLTQLQPKHKFTFTYEAFGPESTLTVVSKA